MLGKLGALRTVQIVLTALLLSATAIATAEQGGRLQELLKKAIDATARGECPQDLMTPLLVSACEDQQPRMAQRISSLGNIKSFKFMGVQTSQMGPAEVYRVSHERGTMTWMINTDSQGKILVFWTPG